MGTVSVYAQALRTLSVTLRGSHHAAPNWCLQAPIEIDIGSLIGYSVLGDFDIDLRIEQPFSAKRAMRVVCGLNGGPSEHSLPVTDLWNLLSLLTSACIRGGMDQ